MKRLKRIGIVLGVIILILAVAPFCILLDDYIPQIEKEASTRLKELVKIKTLREAALPLLDFTLTPWSSGNVNISPAKELSGRRNAQVATMDASAGVPLNVCISPDPPLLFPAGRMRINRNKGDRRPGVCWT